MELHGRSVRIDSIGPAISSKHKFARNVVCCFDWWASRLMPLFRLLYIDGTLNINMAIYLYMPGLSAPRPKSTPRWRWLKSAISATPLKLPRILTSAINQESLWVEEN